MKTWKFLLFVQAVCLVDCDRVVNFSGGSQSVQIYQSDGEREATTEKSSSKSSSRRPDLAQQQNSSQGAHYSFNFNNKIFDGSSSGNIFSIGNQNSFQTQSNVQVSTTPARPSSTEATSSDENTEQVDLEAEEIQTDLRRRNSERNWQNNFR